MGQNRHRLAHDPYPRHLYWHFPLWEEDGATTVQQFSRLGVGCVEVGDKTVTPDEGSQRSVKTGACTRTTQNGNQSPVGSSRAQSCPSHRTVAKNLLLPFVLRYLEHTGRLFGWLI